MNESAFEEFFLHFVQRTLGRVDPKGRASFAVDEAEPLLFGTEHSSTAAYALRLPSGSLSLRRDKDELVAAPVGATRDPGPVLG